MVPALPFALAYVAPALTAVGLALGGLWAWSTPVFAFVVTPLLDQLLPPNRSNPAPDEAARRASERWWNALLLAWLPVELALVLATLVAVTEGGAPVEVAGWIISLGVMTGGGGITVAHELMHRRERLHRGVAEVLMALVLYPHFCIEHILGHHRHVATPHDPASARRGESVWAFLPRTVIGGLRSAWRLESDRVRAKAVGPLGDRRLRHPLLVAGIVACAYGLGGLPAVGALVGQAAVAVLLLEVINYVEHYGLARAERSDGRFERVRPEHSWNSAHRVTSWYLFNLPRHADHHVLAHRPYALLRHLEASPQLPAGYPTMILLALVPPLWRRVMDPRVDAVEAARSEPLEVAGASPASDPSPSR